MELNQKKIADMMKKLEEKALQLERENASEEAQDKVRNEQVSLARVVSRNAMKLHQVERFVFVSTRFDDDARGNPMMPAWLDETFKLINEAQTRRGHAHYKAIIGKVSVDEGGFLQAIQKNMLKSHFFLSVFTADPDQRNSQWPVNPWLIEELAATFVIPIPAIITVEDKLRHVPLRDFGRLYPTDLPRFYFSINNLNHYADELGKALNGAYKGQWDLIERTKRGVARHLA